MITITCMATNATLLCIHRDPSPLAFLKENGYEVLTANNGHEGLRLFITRHVDAIVLEYHLGFLDGGVVAAEIKKTRPQVPILMIIDHLEVPEGALRSVDMVVARFDGGPFLLSALRSVLDPKPPALSAARKPKGSAALPGKHPGSQSAGIEPGSSTAKDRLSKEEWHSVIDGTIKFQADS